MNSHRLTCDSMAVSDLETEHRVECRLTLKPPSNPIVNALRLPPILCDAFKSILKEAEKSDTVPQNLETKTDTNALMTIESLSA